MNWETEKKKVIEKLEGEIHEGKVDKDIIDLLRLINSHPNYVTLSSCSGRIVVLDLPKFGDKKACKFLGKWHEKAKAEEVIKALKKCKKQGWFIMQPAIFHVQCKTLQDAGNLINIAYSSGFRESGIISLRKNVVRIFSSEKIETILAKNGKLLVSEEYIKTLVEIANEKLERVKTKVEKLRKEVEKFL